MPKPNGNSYDLTGEYGIGYTAKGESFYFDKEDFKLIRAYSWWIDKKGYVCTTTDNHKSIKQHRLIMDCPKNLQVDHIHQKNNDNRKSQLRICTNQENHRNKPPSKNNISGKTGVSLNKRNGKWRAYITIDNRQKSLGHFNTFEEATEIRLKAEMELFGNFRYKER